MADLSPAPSGPSVGACHDLSGRLTAKQIKFVDAIAEGATLKDGATTAGIGYRTAKRWHKHPDIVEAVRARLSANLSQARAVLASGAAGAARSLVELSEKAKSGDGPRVTAARAVLESASQLIEVEELQRQLAELERRDGRR